MTKTRRSTNFTPEETELLMRLIEDEKHIIDNKKLDAVSNAQKTQSWLNIETKFNALSGTTYRNLQTLHYKYENIKKQEKKREKGVICPQNKTEFRKVISIKDDSDDYQLLEEKTEFTGVSYDEVYEENVEDVEYDINASAIDLESSEAVQNSHEDDSQDIERIMLEENTETDPLTNTIEENNILTNRKRRFDGKSNRVTLSQLHRKTLDRRTPRHDKKQVLEIKILELQAQELRQRIDMQRKVMELEAEEIRRRIIREDEIHKQKMKRLKVGILD